MTAQDVVEGLKLIGKVYSGIYHKDAIDVVMPELIKEPSRALGRAYERIITETAGRTLPSLAAVLKVTQEEGRKIRQQEANARDEEWRKRKQEFKEAPPIEERKQFDQYGKDAVTALKMMRTSPPLGVTDRDHRLLKLENFRKMDERYPGRGWAYEGQLLKTEWEEKGWI
jgi:hypothetical protein